MLAEIANKKLRVVESKGRSDVAIQLSQEEIQTDVWFSANMELWYNSIQEFTFPTVFLPLNKEVASILCDYYDVKKDQNRKLTIEQETSLKLLSSQIDDAIKGLDAQESGVFIKLSSRSPKDATVIGQKMDDLYKKITSGRQSLEDNDKLIALYSSHLQALKVDSGSEGVDLLTQSHRIYEDLKLELNDPVASSSSDFKNEIVIRKWISIDIMNEFRGFVKNNTLTALSQYYDMCYFPELNQNKATIQNRIQTFFSNHIKDRVTFTNDYIIDFCITTDNEIYVIELNPFHPNTDAGLFKWSHDSSILNGESPFEFRVLPRAIKNAKNCTFSFWKKYFEG